MRKLCPCGQSFLVFHFDLLLSVKRKYGCFTTIQVGMVHGYTCDLKVIIGGVIIDSAIRIAAACIDGLFEGTAYSCAAFLLSSQECEKTD